MFIQLCDKSMLFYFFSPYCAVAKRNIKIHKNIGGKTEFYETNFCDEANFNNFRGI